MCYLCIYVFHWDCTLHGTLRLVCAFLLSKYYIDYVYTFDYIFNVLNKWFSTKSIEEWDCTALFSATIYAKSFGVSCSRVSTLNDLYLKKVKHAPGTFHLSVQSSTGNQDETYAFPIDQLRLLRDTLSHSSELEIVKRNFDHYVPGADPGRGESGSSHGQIFSTLEYFALTFLKILD